jgi:hypothetical protein
MRLLRPFALAVLCLSLPQAAPAQQPAEAPAANQWDASLAFRFLTLGLGVEAAKLLVGHLGARVGANFFSWSTSHSQSGISYDATVKLHGISALFDFYLHNRGSFHISGGVITTPFQVTAVGQPDSGGTFKINGTKYTSAQVGTLNLDAKFKTGPYLGVGWGTPANRGGGLSLVFDLGAIFGKANVNLTASNPGNDPTLAANVQAQQAKTQHDLRKFLKVYPVLSLGLAYHR